MPRARLPPRLYLRGDEKGKRVWIIRDMQTSVRTGFVEAEYDQAEACLRSYIDGSFKPQALSEAISYGCVYYVSIAGSNTYPIKIGYSSGSVSSRVNDLQMGNPNLLTCLASERGNWQTEKERHRRFRAFHIRGEWYGRSADLLRHVASLPGNEVIPFDLEQHLAQQRAKMRAAQIGVNAVRIEGAQNETDLNEVA